MFPMQNMAEIAGKVQSDLPDERQVKTSKTKEIKASCTIFDNCGSSSGLDSYFMFECCNNRHTFFQQCVKKKDVLI